MVKNVNVIFVLIMALVPFNIFGRTKMLLKEVGTLNMTIEALDKIEKLLDKSIEKETAKIESWDAKDFIFSNKYLCPICETPEDGTCQVLKD